MAKLFELKTHEDEFPNKRAITADEIIFLKDLQHRINTQDHIAQADPRYWVIRDYERYYGKDLNDSDGWVIIDTEESGEALVDSKNLAVDTGSCENYLDAVIRTTLKEIKDNDMLSEYFDEDCFDAKLWKHNVVDCSYDVESFVSNLNDFIIDPDRFAILEYEDVATDTNAFLSHEAAQAFLKSNSHHFGPDAHTYAVTAWRNPDAEKLIKLLHEVDFDLLLSATKKDFWLKENDYVELARDIETRFGAIYEKGLKGRVVHASKDGSVTLEFEPNENKKFMKKSQLIVHKEDCIREN